MFSRGGLGLFRAHGGSGAPTPPPPETFNRLTATGDRRVTQAGDARRTE